jgi:hypothetical protein
MRVRFLQQYCAWHPGADPVLCDADAENLIALGFCEPFDKPPAKAKKPEPELVAETPAEPLEAHAPPVRRGRFSK